MRISKTYPAILGAAVLAMLGAATPAQATGYGSINNFDAVNDDDEPCHGFEIEIEDAHSTDVTYTYDWNHYGTPEISEDNTDPAHPHVFVRYKSRKNTDGSWASYTAVPTSPILPTDGHQFTDPSVNFGGEHFGVGFYGNPTVIRYFWLKDDGAGNLVRGLPVNLSTPTFTYIPPGGGNPQVQAVIVPPPPPVPDPLEFGAASWVKETRTQTHNNHQVELRDLVTDDPEDPNDDNWANDEPDEIEVEWQILQTDYNSAGGGANGELVGAPEELPGGDEVITRRYDFFEYIGPIDTETGEAMADSVGPDGIHGEGIKNINGVDVDLSTIEVVGGYIGAQMAGFDAVGQIGLIDHVQDGEVDVPYVDRSVVIAGVPPIKTTVNGTLPVGMTFDALTGILSGTPTKPGLYTFTIHSVDSNAGDVTTTYNLNILESGAVPAPSYNLTTMASALGGGSTLGNGVFDAGATVTATAVADPGFVFVNWTDGGTIVSDLATYEFPLLANREIVANFTAGEPASISNWQIF